MAGKKNRDKKRKKKERQRVSARRMVDEHRDNFGLQTINLPEGITMFNVRKEGMHKIDILPFIAGKGNKFADEGELYFERIYWSHRGIGSDNNSYVCPAKTIGKKCPICEFRSKLMKEEDADENLIKSLAPKERQLWAVLDHKEKEKGVKIWEVAWFSFGKKLKAKIDNQEEGDDYEYFADPKDGMTLRLGFEEQSYPGGTFIGVSDIEFRPRREELDQDLLDSVPCLDDLLVIKDYEELKKIFLEGDIDNNDDDEDSKKSKKSKKKMEDDDEEFDDDEVPWDDDSDDDDSDDDDSDDDEEFDDDDDSNDDDSNDDDDDSDDDEEFDDDDDSNDDDSDDDDSDDNEEFDDEEITEADVKKMSKKDILELIEDEELKIKTKGKKLTDLRKAVIKKLF